MVMEPESVKILLADDHALFREGLRHMLINLDPGIRIVEATDYPEALAVVESEKHLNLALVDLNMPGMEQFTGLAALAEKLGDVPIVVVSANENGDDVRRAMGCGASSYIPKALDSNVVRTALEKVLGGGTYLPPSMVGWQEDDPIPKAPPPPRLTPRQRDVLGFIAKGYSNKKIATELSLAEGTVKLHVASLLKVLGVNNRTEAVFKATAWGLIVTPSPADSMGRH